MLAHAVARTSGRALVSDLKGTSAQGIWAMTITDKSEYDEGTWDGWTFYLR